MKILFGNILFVLSLICFSEVSAQESATGKTDTVTLNVPGVCMECKGRIETAVYDVSGVKSAKWDLETSVLTAVINPKKTSVQKIADALAKVGYRSDLAEADPVAYQKLPGCCQYDSGIDKH